jgi:hypothetical protein
MKFAALIVSMIVLAGILSAHAADQSQPYTACDADRYRYCRNVEGIPAIVACMQEHRAVLSKACDAFLKEHGQ